MAPKYFLLLSVCHHACAQIMYLSFVPLELDFYFSALLVMACCQELLELMEIGKEQSSCQTVCHLPHNLQSTVLVYHPPSQLRGPVAWICLYHGKSQQAF